LIQVKLEVLPILEERGWRCGVLVKVCRCCNEELEIKYFSKRSSSKDGFHYYCKDCHKKHCKEWKERNRDKHRQGSLRWARKNKQRHKQNCKNWVENNKERTRELKRNWARNNYCPVKRREYRLKNIDRDRETSRAWSRNNRGKRNAVAAERRAMLLCATPPWITESMREEIKNIYIKADIISKKTGIKHHVDHIMPLKSEKLCGLHVPWNLQILTAEENIKKSNRVNFWRVS
jgi:hypothetical protein